MEHRESRFWAEGTVWFKQSCSPRCDHASAAGSVGSSSAAAALLLFLVTHRVLLHSLGQLSGKQVLSATSDERVKDEFSDLSEG